MTTITQPRLRTRPAGLWGDAWRRLRRDPLAMVSLSVIAVYFLVAVVVAAMQTDAFQAALETFGVKDPAAEVPLVDPMLQYEKADARPPSRHHPFGTDILGMDVLVSTLNGAKVSILIGVGVALITVTIGLAIGTIAGYNGGVIDTLIVWLYTTVASVPGILLILSLASVLGRGYVTIYVAMSATAWVGVCRIVRGETLKHRESEYVLAARALGASGPRILVRHIIPNVFHIVIIQASLLIIGAISSLVILDYLQVGIQGQPTWGIMITESRDQLTSRGMWWPLAAATGAMFVLILAFNFLGDGLRDALDPRLSEGG